MLTLTRSSSAKNNVDNETTAESLIADQVAIIFGFLEHNEIMHARVCTTWRDAAKKTLVPLSYFQVKDMTSYNALRVMATALPNLQQLEVGQLGDKCKYSDGEDPNEEVAARTSNYATHDLNIISNFRKLRILHVQYNFRALNGRYPALFNFPMLQILKISICPFLKWDLDMLSGCPLLRKLCLTRLQGKSTGNLSSLRVLKNTLEEVQINDCCNIRGNFMELADFPCLKTLDIFDSPITGDIQHIQEDDLPSLETLLLPSTVIGGFGHQFQRISDVPGFMQAIHPLLNRFPESFNQESVGTQYRLSKDSADWYEYEDEATSGYPNPPFEVRPVLAGSRWGWRWCSLIDVDNLFCICFSKWQHCEINWLDPEPSEDSDDYDEYVESLQKIEDETEFYRGYYEPPTEVEYRRLCLRGRED